MDTGHLQEMAAATAILFVLGMIFCSLGLATLYYMGWWLTNRPGSYSPYSKRPMVLGNQLSFEAVEKVHNFLLSQPDGENLVFDLTRAAVCRETGRIFPDAVNSFDVIKLKKNFVSGVYPGKFVLWGTLSFEFQESLREKHHSLEGFQTQGFDRESDFTKEDRVRGFVKPGPLYVDVETGVVIGWKRVLGTELEVFIVQKPKSNL